MLRVRPRHAAALAAGALLLVGCADGGPVAPTVRPSLDLAAGEAGPDSGALVVWPSDGPQALAAANARAFGASAAATPAPGPSIRIGVIRQATAVHLGAPGAWTLRDKANGLVLLTGTGGAVTVTIAEAAVAHYRLQIMCGNLAAVQAAKDAAEAAGVATFTEFVPSVPCTRLFLGEFASNESYGVRNAFRNQTIAQGLSGTDSFWKVVQVGGNTVYAVERGATSFESLNPVVLTANDGGVVTIGGVDDTTIVERPYRGKAEARQSGVALAGINELPMEEYLYGVVPRELGPSVYPEIEAQKAQAVAARTYALRGLGKRASDGYDLRATTDDQVYGGYGDEHPVSTRAVDETAGIAMRVGGQLIDALFSSTSGGHTADSEEAFSAVLSYLRGVPDAQRGAALEHVPSLAVFRAHANPQSLRALREGDFESDWARFHRWSFEWTMEEMTAVISAWAKQPVGRVLAINVLERGPSGRVTLIEYVTEAGAFTHARDGIRSSLRYINASGAPSNLLSTLFFVEPVLEPGTKATVGWRVYGGGFGHGVGMAQTGAVGMAQKGRSYDEILRHYYQGIELATGY